MSSINRKGFQSQHVGQQMEIRKADRQQLAEAGITVKDLKAHDFNRDNKINAFEAWSVATSAAQGQGASEATAASTDRVRPNQQVLSALGLMIQSAKEASGASSVAPQVDLSQIESQFDMAIKQLQEQGSLDGLQSHFQEIEGQLRPAITQQEEVLAQKQHELSRAEDKLGFFERNLGFLSPEPVQQLRDEIGGIETWLEEAKAYQSGARIGLRTGQGDNPNFDAQALAARFQEALSAVPSRGVGEVREQALADTIHVQEDIQLASDQARLAQHSNSQDVENLSEEVPWYQRWGWLDKIGGESARGALYRTGKDQNMSSHEVASSLEQVATRTDGQVDHSVQQLLREESPAFKTADDRLTVLNPAYNRLQSVQSHVRDALRDVSDAQSAILLRNSLKMQEPMTRYETDPETGMQRETDAYSSWESQYSSAKHNAMYYSERAESELRSLQRDLPSLKSALQNVGEDFSGRGTSTEISDFWTLAFDVPSFWGMSYDYHRADNIEDQLYQLSNELSRIDGRLGPEVRNTRSYVSGQTASRRSQLSTLES